MCFYIFSMSCIVIVVRIKRQLSVIYNILIFNCHLKFIHSCYVLLIMFVFSYCYL